MYGLPKTWTTANQRHVHCMILTYTFQVCNLSARENWEANFQ